MLKKHNKYTNNLNDDAVVVELFSKEKLIYTSIEQHNVLEYIQSMAKELSDLSEKADNSLLVYLFSLTAHEARRAREVSAS